MSSIVMSSSSTTTTTTTQQTNDFNKQLNKQNDLDERERNLIIERIIAILSEDKQKPIWFDIGLADEYRRRYKQAVPQNWIKILEDCGRDVVEVEVLSLSNVTKTLIKLPIRPKQKRRESAPTTAQQTAPAATTPAANTSAAPPVVTASEPPAQQTIAEQELSVKFSETNISSKPLDDNRRNESSQKALADRREGVVVEEKESSAVTVDDSSETAIKVTNTKSNAQKSSNGCVIPTEDVITGGKAIPAPILPPVVASPTRAEDFFDLIVLFAANPSNFIVVPFNNLQKGSAFSELKHKMFEMYERDDNRIDLPPEVIRSGLYVAVKARSSWYRMLVKTVISDDPFQVVGYLCDYGEVYTCDDLHDIQPLYNCFRDLPAQAVKAALASVEPIGKDWDVFTTIEFRTMVENKPFVATVCAITEDDSEPVLWLSLCDTSGADDLYIGTELIAKGMAKSKK